VVWLGRAPPPASVVCGANDASSPPRWPTSSASLSSLPCTCACACGRRPLRRVPGARVRVRPPPASGVRRLLWSRPTAPQRRQRHVIATVARRTGPASEPSSGHTATTRPASQCPGAVPQGCTVLGCCAPGACPSLALPCLSPDAGLTTLVLDYRSRSRRYRCIEDRPRCCSRRGGRPPTHVPGGHARTGRRGRPSPLRACLDRYLARVERTRLDLDHAVTEGAYKAVQGDIDMHGTTPHGCTGPYTLPHTRSCWPRVAGRRGLVGVVGREGLPAVVLEQAPALEDVLALLVPLVVVVRADLHGYMRPCAHGGQGAGTRERPAAPRAACMRLQARVRRSIRRRCRTRRSGCRPRCARPS